MTHDNDWDTYEDETDSGIASGSYGPAEGSYEIIDSELVEIEDEAELLVAQKHNAGVDKIVQLLPYSEYDLNNFHKEVLLQAERESNDG